MDLSQFDTQDRAEAGVDFPLVMNGRTIYGDDDEPIVFRVRGLDDDRVRQELMRQDKKPSKTPQELRENELRVARIAVVGWSDNFTVNGEKLAYSKENLEKVFSNHVLCQAVIVKVFDQEAFMKGS